MKLAIAEKRSVEIVIGNYLLAVDNQRSNAIYTRSITAIRKKNINPQLWVLCHNSNRGK